MTEPPKTHWDTWDYHLGCPVWNCRDWENEVYPKGTSASASLRWYSRMFNTSEGNSTFYGLPSLDTAHHWCQQTPEGFRFSMKFPREISHDTMLHGCDAALRKFLDVLEVLHQHDRLGPTFLQLGPSFSYAFWDRLKRFTSELPTHFPWSIEVRHRDWFDEGRKEQQLDDHLRALGIDRALFDSRPLFSCEASDESERAAQKRKPQSPFRQTVTGRRPMLRLIGLNDAEKVTPWWDEWTSRVAKWIDEGLEPWIFTHAPDDAKAPPLARRFHSMLLAKRAKSEPILPSLPVGNRSGLTQLSLFD